MAELKRKGEDATDILAQQPPWPSTSRNWTPQPPRPKPRWKPGLCAYPTCGHLRARGKDETENVEVARWGTPPAFDFTPREHGELGAALDGLDFERAARLTGSRFVVRCGWAPRLERALVNFFLDQHTKNEGYIEVCPPYMVNRATMTGTASCPSLKKIFLSCGNGTITSSPPPKCR